MGDHRKPDEDLNKGEPPGNSDGRVPPPPSGTRRK